MPRTVDPVRHGVRRDAFVDAAQRLIATKGYKGLSIQDVLDAVGASKGAFYHYFDSKQGLLEAVVDRMTDGALAEITPIAARQDLPAVGKLEAMFAAMARFKAERRELVLGLLDVWLSDDNAIVREKARRGGAERLAPLLATIIRDGLETGELRTGSPDETARVLVSLMTSAHEELAAMVVRGQRERVPLEIVERTIDAYTGAVERILGLPAGSLTILDPDSIRLWFA